MSALFQLLRSIGVESLSTRSRLELYSPIWRSLKHQMREREAEEIGTRILHEASTSGFSGRVRAYTLEDIISAITVKKTGGSPWPALRS